MAISDYHAHDASQPSDPVKASQPDELVETDPDSTNLEKQQQYAQAEGVESFQPVEGVEYNVTFKTWLVVAVSGVFSDGDWTDGPKTD
jgi:hypothetical protein